jgi:hypothetical protein
MGYMEGTGYVVVEKTAKGMDTAMFKTVNDLIEFGVNRLSESELVELRDSIVVRRINSLRIEKYLGQSISHATLRTQDLIAAFVPVLEDLDWQEKWWGARNCGNELLKLYRESETLSDEFEDSASYYLNEELWDVLREFAPEGYYFGAHEGDGSDFGFWQIAY